jgi:hypothetical protein
MLRIRRVDKDTRALRLIKTLHLALLDSPSLTNNNHYLKEVRIIYKQFLKYCYFSLLAYISRKTLII